MKIISFATCTAVLGFLPFTLARLPTAKTIQQEETDFQAVADIVSKKKKKEGWRNIINVDFQIHHFKSENAHDTNSFDQRLASGILSQAIAEVFPEMETNWGFVDNIMEIPEPADNSVIQDWINGYYYYWIPGLWSQDICCRFCPPDLLEKSNDKGPSFAKFIEDKERWEQVGELLCSKLRETGYPAYADVSECYVSCGLVSGNDEDLIEAAATTMISQEPDQVKYSTKHGGSQAQVTVHQLQQSPNFSIDSLENAFAVAYNNVFNDIPYSVESVEVIRRVNAPEHAGSGQDTIHFTESEITVTDDAGSAFDTSIFWVKLDWKCGEETDCDGIPNVSAVQLLQQTKRHSILESFVCHNLRESGDEAFADATGCSIAFDY